MTSLGPRYTDNINRNNKNKTTNKSHLKIMCNL